MLIALLLGARVAAADVAPSVDGVTVGTPIDSVIEKLGEPWYQQTDEGLWGPHDHPVRLIKTSHGRVLIVTAPG